MAEGESKELGPEDFERLAATLDATGEVQVPDETPAAPQETSKEDPDSESQTETEPKPDEPKADEAEGEKVPDDKPETKESEYTKAQKDRDRLDRNWKKQQELADQVRRDREELERERAEFRKQRQSSDKPASDPDEKGFTAEQYDSAYEEFLLEGDKEKATIAKERAKELRTKTHQRLWMENVEAVKKENPGIDDPANPLHKASMKVLQEMPILGMFPDGAKHAVRIAKVEMNDSLISGLKTENAKLQDEIKRLNKSLELGSSGPNRLPSEKDFGDMSPKEQERELSRMAEEADRMGFA